MSPQQLERKSIKMQAQPRAMLALYSPSFTLLILTSCLLLMLSADGKNATRYRSTRYHATRYQARYFFSLPWQISKDKNLKLSL
jgi:hypothetical protein